MQRRNQALNWIDRARLDVARQAAQVAQQRQARENAVYAARMAKHTAGAVVATGALAAKDYVTPKKASKGTSGISPKDKMPTHIRDEDHEMDTGPDESKALVSARAADGGGGDGRKGSQETRISKQMPHFGLPETITAVMPNTTYFSIITPTTPTTMTKFQFRLTSMLDPILTNLTPATAGAVYTAGVYDAPMNTQTSGSFSNPLRVFPSSATDRSQWRAYYHKMYQYYAVLGVEWEITMYNPQLNRNCDIVWATTVDTYSAQSNTNVHPDTTMREMEMWPDVRWGVVRSDNTGASEFSTRTIKGYYKPGMVKQNVENDEDIKTWTKVAAQPSLTEVMNFYVGKSWLNDVSVSTGLNCRITLRQIVQYKDLNVQFRWPATGQTAVTLTAPADILT